MFELCQCWKHLDTFGAFVFLAAQRILGLAAAMVAGDFAGFGVTSGCQCAPWRDSIQNLNPCLGPSFRCEESVNILLSCCPTIFLKCQDGLWSFPHPVCPPGLRHRMSELEPEQLSFAKGMAKFPKPLRAILQALWFDLSWFVRGILQSNPSVDPDVCSLELRGKCSWHI